MIYVTRHGQTDWNVMKRVMGRCDEPLNQKGFEQARITRDKLYNKKIDIIICSPLLRTQQTANIINENRNIEIIYDERIIERDFGEFEGLETKDFDFWGYWDYYKNEKYKRAENIQDFFRRIYDFLDDITSKYNGKSILIVAHGGVSIPIGCYFRKNIPEGTLVETDLVLKNCQIVEYMNNQPNLYEDSYKFEYNININKQQLVELFTSVGWKTAEYPNRLYKAIKNSDYVMSIWEDNNLIGLISAISDGAINVFITYLLVNPKYQKQGLGKIMMKDFIKKFEGYGRRILSTELDKEKYYNKFGFTIDGIVMFNKDWKEDLED